MYFCILSHEGFLMDSSNSGAGHPSISENQLLLLKPVAVYLPSAREKQGGAGSGGGQGRE